MALLEAIDAIPNRSCFTIICHCLFNGMPASQEVGIFLFIVRYQITGASGIGMGQAAKHKQKREPPEGSPRF